jgi:hypothetical protein
LLDNVSSGAYKYLITFPSVTSLVLAFPLTDPITPNAGKPYIFDQPQGTAPGATGPLATMEGTSGVAIVLGDMGGWSAPAAGSSMRFQRLSVEVWVDPLRDSGRNISESPGATVRRGRQCFDAIHKALQRQEAGGAIVWGDLVTVGCSLLNEPQFVVVADGDQMYRGPAMYGVTVAGHSDALV